MKLIEFEYVINFRMPTVGILSQWILMVHPGSPLEKKKKIKNISSRENTHVNIVIMIKTTKEIFNIAYKSKVIFIKTKKKLNNKKIKF